MVMAVARIVIVTAALLCHFVSLRWTLPLSSNWRQMDDKLVITFMIIGVFFVAILLFNQLHPDPFSSA